MAGHLLTAVDRTLSLALGLRCAVCAAPLETVAAGAACPACWSAVPRYAPPWCARCGVPLPPWRRTSLALGCCAWCRRAPGYISRLRAAGPYDGALRGAIHALKYGRRPSVAGPLGALMRHAGAEILAEADAVVPVPLHSWRAWRRGFNQADLLARRLGLPVWPLLRRIRATPPQAALGAGARRRNVRGAFALGPLRQWPAALAWAHAFHPLEPVRNRLRGASVVLVDDVCTTGATLEACAQVLRDAGAREIRGLTAARALPGVATRRQ